MRQELAGQVHPALRDRPTNAATGNDLTFGNQRSDHLQLHVMLVAKLPQSFNAPPAIAAKIEIGTLDDATRPNQPQYDLVEKLIRREL